MSETSAFNPAQVAQQIETLLGRPSNNFGNDQEALKFALSILDLTTLEGSDNSARVKALCAKAGSYTAKGLPNVAAVCVYPVFVRQCKEMLKGSGIHTASVAGAFPAGQSPLSIKVAEVKFAVDEGADEIDMVISRGKFMEGNLTEVFDEVSAIKEACGQAHLKVILETGELADLNKIYEASILAMKAGGDFIKTSTGKINPAATPEAAFVMLQAIRDFHESTGRFIGFKPAGGVSTPEQALIYVRLVEQMLGPEWLSSQLFRIGASRLADGIVQVLM